MKTYVSRENIPTPYELFSFLAGSFGCSTKEVVPISLFPGALFDSGSDSLKFPEKFICFYGERSSNKFLKLFTIFFRHCF